MALSTFEYLDGCVLRWDPLKYRWIGHPVYLGKEGPVKVDAAVALGKFANPLLRCHAQNRIGFWLTSGRCMMPSIVEPAI